MSITFMIFTFAGAGYMLMNHGKVSVGYVVPMSICLVRAGIIAVKIKNDS